MCILKSRCRFNREFNYFLVQFGFQFELFGLVLACYWKTSFPMDSGADPVTWWWQTFPCWCKRWPKHPAGLVLSPRTHTICCCANSLKAEPVTLLCICAIYSLGMDVTLLLTERIYVFPDYQGKAAACVVNAEEDHGHVLRGAHASPQGSWVAVIHIALVQGQRVVLGAGELLSFHHPAIKHLHGRH